MSRSSRNLGVRVLPPEIPPKSFNLHVDEFEPLYMTTLPSSEPPEIPEKPRGILKNVTRKPPSFRNLKPKPITNSNNDEARQFNLTIKDVEDYEVNDQNVRNSLNASKHSKKENKLNNTQFSKSERNDKAKEKEKDKAKAKAKAKEKEKNNKKNKRENISDLPPETYAKAVIAARMESVSGIMHLLVIVCSIITLISMAILTNDWELMLRRCPLYVQTSQSDGIYWGNENLTPCHYTAYMPALTLIMSFSLILFHGGILLSWRRGYQAYKIMLSKTYGKIMFSIELLETAIAISITCVLIDGVRQTCLGFQMSPWSVERPGNCKEGYADRDEVYGISKTYAKLMTSMIASLISASLLFITSIIYLVKINPCCKGKLRQ